MRLYDVTGSRLYLTPSEIDKFLIFARDSNGPIRSFAETLVFTGCRISEALNIRVKDIKRKELQITINSLKKRRGDLYRDLPVPDFYMNTLEMAHDIVKRQRIESQANTKLWDWSRQYGHKVITKLMKDAGIAPGSHRTPKGIRHAYGVYAITEDVPLNMLQKWMGHADITTTTIYANAIGEEEAVIAEKMFAKKRIKLMGT